MVLVLHDLSVDPMKYKGSNLQSDTSGIMTGISNYSLAATWQDLHWFLMGTSIVSVAPNYS